MTSPVWKRKSLAIQSASFGAGYSAAVAGSAIRQHSASKKTRDKSDGTLLARLLVSRFGLPAVGFVTLERIGREMVTQVIETRDNRVAPTPHRRSIRQKFVWAAKPCVLE